MADCACDFCEHADVDCPHVWAWSDCYVDTIKAARAVVNDEFIYFLAKLEAKNEALCDDTIGCLIGWMRNIIQSSHEPLPEWALYEEEV